MGKILYPLEYAVAWLMVQWHTLLSFIGLPEESGLTWALSIVGLVIVIRIILIPLFVKQIKASRGLQLIQPDIADTDETGLAGGVQLFHGAPHREVGGREPHAARGTVEHVGVDAVDAQMLEGAGEGLPHLGGVVGLGIVG